MFLSFVLPFVLPFVLSFVLPFVLSVLALFHRYPNIIVSGGNTMYDGFGPRLQREMEILRGPNLTDGAGGGYGPRAGSQGRGGNRERVKVIAPPERGYSVWIGGAILASLSTFQAMWVTKEHYEEQGPSCASRCNQ